MTCTNASTRLLLFEVLFLVVLAAGIVRLLCGPVLPHVSYRHVGVVGLGLLVLGAIVHGLRWPMIPAYLAFGVLMLTTLKKPGTRLVWRAVGALPLLLLLSVSAFLVYQLPVFTLPAPTGPYGVGTFDFSITDESRRERYSPDRNRELYVEVWYPADRVKLDGVPVRTLFQELYEGDYTRQSFLFGYLRHVSTHSHVQAPLAASSVGRFPVLLFNHALAPGFTSQNQLLMEHLASHGYVILSIAHPYQSSKVNLGRAGTITVASGYPPDLSFARPELEEGVVGRLFAASRDLKTISALKKVLSPLAEQYLTLDERERGAFLRQIVAREDLQPWREFISEELLEDYFVYDFQAENSLIQYWVDDIRFVADSVATAQVPVAGFQDSIDASGFGVFGMSYGGAAATEFCKTDKRCRAGANLDGTQFGSHWNQPVPAPFLMFYNEEHQGGNDFAYLPAANEFWEYTIEGATHFDFTDFTYAVPLFRAFGLTGSIDGGRMIGITNSVMLNFFDHTLKDEPVAEELFSDTPEIVVRHHAVEVRPAVVLSPP